MVTQKDMKDKRLHCLLSPPPPHSEAASDSQQPHSTSGSTVFAPHRSDHVTSSVSMDTAHLEREKEKVTKRKISVADKENRQKAPRKTKIFVHLITEEK